MVILPGLLCDNRMFACQIDAFPDAVALAGFYNGSNTIEAMADFALARMPPECALCGHSMGGRVALEIIRKAPDRVTRLLLSSTGIHTVKAGESAKRHALRDLGRAEGFHALVDSWLPPMLSQAARIDRDLVDCLRGMCIAAGQETFEAQIEALLARPPVYDLLPRITCPTMVVVGELDVWSPIGQHIEIAAAIPNAVLRIVPGAGHMLPIEAAAPFNECLREWLALPETNQPVT